MNKGDIIKVKVSNGVEVKAVILDIIEEEYMKTHTEEKFIKLIGKSYINKG